MTFIVRGFLPVEICNFAGTYAKKWQTYLESVINKTYCAESWKGYCL